MDLMPLPKAMLHPTCRVAQRIIDISKEANIQPAAGKRCLPEKNMQEKHQVFSYKLLYKNQHLPETKLIFI